MASPSTRIGPTHIGPVRIGWSDLAVLIGAVAAAAVLWWLGHRSPGPDPAAYRVPEAPAVQALRAWDAARADAWARGDPAALARLYVDGAGRSDVALLRAYRDRGYVVRGLRRQLLGVRLLDHGRDWLRMRVTDRLVGGAAVGAGSRTTLPGTAAQTHDLVLRWRDHAWRMQSVSPR